MKIEPFFSGQDVFLIRKDPLHFDLNVNQAGKASKEVKTFKDMFLTTLAKVNDSQMNVFEMAQKAILEPNNIDTHDVTIAIAKANMNLNITKAIIERSLRAYQDIVNIR